MNEGISMDEIRSALEDYYGTAMNEFPMAAVELGRVQSMSDEDVIQEALKVGIIFINDS